MTFVWLTVIRNVLKYLSGYKDLVAVVKPCWYSVFLMDVTGTCSRSFLTNGRIVSQIIKVMQR